MKLLQTIALTGLWLIFPQIAGAQAIYFYTGELYSEVSDNPDITGEYDNEMRLRGTIEFVNPLEANFDGVIVPVAFSFDDGRSTISNLTGGFFVAVPPRFPTDSDGNIVGWNFIATQGDHDIFSGDATGDFVRLRDGANRDSASSLDPGVWTTDPPAEVTEAIVNDVQDLVEDGLLTFGQGSALSAVLRGAARLLNQDREKQAVPLLRTFVQQVSLLVSLERLDAGAGDLLINQASSVLDRLPVFPG